MSRAYVRTEGCPEARLSFVTVNNLVFLTDARIMVLSQSVHTRLRQFEETRQVSVTIFTMASTMVF